MLFLVGSIIKLSAEERSQSLRLHCKNVDRFRSLLLNIDSLRSVLLNSHSKSTHSLYLVLGIVRSIYEQYSKLHSEKQKDNRKLLQSSK